MLNVYEKHKDKDGYLYIVYTEETSLGWGGGAREQWLLILSCKYESIIRLT